jgi:uncharacterized protein (DUF779 family)
MIKQIIITAFICCIISISVQCLTSRSRVYNHKDVALNAEFDNVYYYLNQMRFMELKTTAELVLIVPNRKGIYYFNTDTNSIWVSTGILVNQFKHF